MTSNRTDGGSKAIHQGFTLIEVLLALSLVGVVVTVAGRVTMQTVHTQRTLRTRLVERSRMDRVFAILENDINARLESTFLLDIDANNRPTIEMFCLTSMPSDLLRQPRFPSRIIYRLIRDGRSNTLNLIREQYDATVRNAVPIRTDVAEGVGPMEVNAYIKNRWHPVDTSFSKKPTEPEALRVRLAIADEIILTRTFFLGQPIELK